MAFLIMVILIFTSPVAGLFTRKFNRVESFETLLEATPGIKGNTSYVSTMPSSPLDLITQTPNRVFQFALSPLPWQVYSFSTMLAWLIDGILRLWIITRMLKFFTRFKPVTPQDKVIKISFMLIIALTYFVFAWGTTNYGTAMRHRAKIFPIEIIVVYSIYEKVKVDSKNINLN